MKNKVYIVYYQDFEFGDTDFYGTFKSYDEALKCFQSEIGKSLVFNILNYCEKDDKTGERFLSTISSDMNNISLISGRGREIDDLETDTLTINRFEEELKEFTFCLGDEKVIVMKTIDFYS